VFEALGVRWAEDIGGESYGLGEKKWGMKFWDNASLTDPRWTYFRLGPQGHNLVTVDAGNPDFMAYTPITAFEKRADGGSLAVVDMRTLYPIAKGGAMRTAEMSAGPDRWVLTDEFKGVPEGTKFVWRMNTYADVKIDGRRATLEREGKKITLSASSGEWRVEVPDLTDQSPAPGLKQLQLFNTNNKEENMVYSVVFASQENGFAFFGAIESVFAYVIALGASVMMPVIFTLLGLCIGIGFKNSIKSGLKVGVGFVGLGVVTALLTSNLGPALKGMVEIYDLKLAFFDLGWPAAAAVAYSCAVGAFIIPVCLGVNVVMLVAGVTRTVNIDLWNYWHFAFLGAMVFFATGSLGWAFYAAIVLYIITLCMADYTAKGFQSYYKDMDGISIPQPFCQSFTPFAAAIGWLYDRIPGISKLDVDAEGLKRKFGLLGEPLFLGVIIGCTIGALKCESLAALIDGIPGILALGVIMGAVMELIPRITSLFIEGLKPISEATRSLVERKFNGAKGLSIGMSPALVIGHPTTLVVSILLIPVILFLSVVLPGNKFLPLASLAGMFYLFPCVLPVTRGNVVKTFVVGLAALVCGLYFVTNLTPAFSKAIEAANCEGIAVPAGFEGGAALDFASALWCWLIYHLTVTFKWIGAAAAGTLALVMCAVNFVRIRKASVQN
jgi:PTS system galactitol-specific IIC component